MHFIDSKVKINLTSIFALRVAAGQTQNIDLRKCTLTQRIKKIKLEIFFWANIEIMKIDNNGELIDYFTVDLSCGLRDGYTLSKL